MTKREMREIVKRLKSYTPEPDRSYMGADGICVRVCGPRRVDPALLAAFAAMPDVYAEAQK